MNGLRLRRLLRAIFECAAAPEDLLLSVLAVRDRALAAHASRMRSLVGRLAALAPSLALDPAALGLGAVLHDFGKVLLPTSLLHSAGPLAPAERELVRLHPLLGLRLLAEVDLPQDAVDSVAHHHERWDGGGYPFALAGARIPLAARLVAILDVYDTLTHSRPYAPTYAPAEALAILRAESGSHFDPALLARVLPILEAAELAETADRPLRLSTGDPA
jgi:HD-GYP domain-containing protein (c-di-GMP phosphodiesterase class II)